jgi:hypothetical protein
MPWQGSVSRTVPLTADVERNRRVVTVDGERSKEWYTGTVVCLELAAIIVAPLLCIFHLFDSSGPVWTQLPYSLSIALVSLRM